MIHRRNRAGISLVQLGAIAGIAIATYFLVDLTRTAWKNYLLSRIVHDQQMQIDRLKADNDRLTEAKKVIESPYFVEAFARQLGWARTGEVPIVTVPAETGGDEVARLLMPQESRGPPRPSSNWQAWWGLFFDTTE